MAWDSDTVIKNVFGEFGYTPSEEEIAALRPSFGEGFGEGVATSTVGQYVNFKRQMDEFNAKDPLTALQTQMDNLITQNQSSVQNLSGQLQDVLTSAPKLFGDLTPDQISTYLDPLKTAFTQQVSQVQAVLASRGLGASSTETNALAQTGEQFQEKELEAGLNIGLTSQKNRADAIQQMINNLFGQTGQAIGVKGQAAGQQSTQRFGESQLIGSLPSFLNAQSAQTAAFNKALNPPGGGFMDTFNKVTSGINQGVNTFSNLLTLGKDISTPLGGVKQSQPVPTTAGQFQSPASQGMGGANYQPPNLNAPGYGEFAATGSMFGS